MANKLKEITIMGICAGNGAVLYPFRRNLMGNVEIRPIFKTLDNKQWKLNFGDIPLFNKAPFMEDVDVVIGHPNCGNSSVLSYSRAKTLTDPHLDESIMLYKNWIKHYQPKIFLFENLPAFLRDGTNPICHFPGYKLKVIRGSVSKFGNSQLTRKRLIIIGIRADLKRVTSSDFKLPNKESLHLKRVKELEVTQIDPQDTFCHIREDINKQIAIFGGKKLTYRQIQEYWLNNPKKKRFETGENKMKNAPGVYRNLPGDYPLTVRKGNREFNSQGLQMTPRERARIMGIPDKFKLLNNPKNITNTINKANVTVTKCFPYEVSLWFKKCLIKILKNHDKIS